MKQEQTKHDLTSAYSVERKSRDWFRLLPRRRSGDYSLPLTLARRLSIQAEFRIGDTLLEESSLHDYVGCSNAESPVRPIPEVFRTTDTDSLTNVVAPELPRLLAWLFKQTEAPYQSYNEVARMGAPFYRPYDDKAWILRKLLPAYLRSDFAITEGHAVQIGVRVQAEALSRVRDYTCLSAEGQVYRRSFDRRKTPVKVWGQTRFPGRVRQVFNQPIFNLLNQITDTALNNVYGKHRAFHHDMTRATPLVKGPVLAFDVSHMERLTARIVYERAKFIGGPYFAFQHYIRQLPFLVPDDTWSAAYFIRCNYDKGWSVQFGSGNSAVSPSQKDIFIILYSLFAESQLLVPREQSFDWVAQGGDDRLRIFNFGDDNFIFSHSGDDKILKDCYAFMQQFLTVGIEEPPKFLGHEYVDGRFQLAISSYLLKTYQNERGPVPPFRKYPNLGWVEKRKHYTQFGDPKLPASIFSREDTLIKGESGGTTSFSDVLYAAAAEKASLDTLSRARREYFLNPNYILGKADYMIDHRDKLAVGSIGGYTGFTPGETRPILLESIDKIWRPYLKDGKS